MFKFLKENTVPDGFRTLKEEEIINSYKELDHNNDYFISKNEWMAHFLGILIKDINYLNQKGPDSILAEIENLSKEFDSYDTNNDKYIDFLEYKNYMEKNIIISL